MDASVLRISAQLIGELDLMMETRKKKLLLLADKWQEEQLKALAKRPFAELSKLPSRTPLDPPAELANLQFAIFRSRGFEGGIDIAVCRFISYPDGEESRYGPSLEIFANGRIIDPFGLIEKPKPLRESAPWFGQTGLDKATERELSHYLRRELGESESDSKSLKAADLTYVGAFREKRATVHYWRIPWKRKRVYAYVLQSSKHLVMGWGDREPSEK